MADHDVLALIVSAVLFLILVIATSKPKEAP